MCCDNSRRTFLKTLGAGLAVGICSPLLRPSCLLAQSIGSGKNIVVVNLFGGVDGLGAYPYIAGPQVTAMRDTLRPTLFLDPVSVLPALNQSGLATKLGFHPAFQPLYDIAKNEMKIVQNYGIVGDPGRSHDTCQVLMSLGKSSLNDSGVGDDVGFLARLMDSRDWETFQYWAFVSENASDTNTRKKSPVIVSDLNSLTFNSIDWAPSGEKMLFDELRDGLFEVASPATSLASQYQESLDAIRKTVAVVRNDIISQTVGSYADSYFGSQLRDAMKVLKAKKTSSINGLSNKDTVMYVGKGGFDTHSNQNNIDSGESLASLIGDLAGNLATFVSDLKSNQLYADTVIVVFSEFGRTVYENGTHGSPSVGTDHGHGSNTLVLGGAIQGGVIGAAPSVSELGNEEYNALNPTIDVRDIFSDIFTWMNIAPKSVFDDINYTPTNLGLLT